MVVAAVLMLLGAPPLDSAALLRRAHRAQADFEWRRIARLPLGSARAGGECDAVIGRFCYWHDATAAHPPSEPAEISTARERLIAVLDSVADSLPGDEWVVGQQVRYLIEAARPADALRRLRSCEATRWWCEALGGLAYHVAGDFAAADRLFQTALVDMSPAQRCRWTDLSALLEGPLSRRYARLDCADRRSLNTRIWWLAQPLWSRVGNDRRTEHFARLTLAMTWRQSASPYGLVNGDDLTELTARYGWPVGWARSTPSSGLDVRRVVIGSEREPAFHFVPESLAFPGATGRDDRPWATERYAPAYLDTFAFFEPKVAAFRRGDSSLVVTRFDFATDTLFRAKAPAVALVLARDALTPLVIERWNGVPDSGVLVAHAPWAARGASLEILAPAARRAARGRTVLRDLWPRNARLVVSDLLPFEPRDSLPQDLEEVLARVRSLTEARRGSRVGLYWEVYGAAATGEPLTTSVSVTPAHRGWLGRVAGVLGLTRRPRPVEVDWRETVVSRDGVAARALVVDLSTLPAGAYHIEVRLRGAGGASASATRALRIVPG
jgi:hypothetical protein